MALQLLEGFDWLESADVESGYGAMAKDSPFGGGTFSIASGGRNGGKCLEITPQTGTNDHDTARIQAIAVPIPSVADGAEVIVGFAVKWTTADRGYSAFFGIASDTGSETTRFNFMLARSPSGQLQWWNGNSAFKGSGTKQLSVGIWYYIEVKFTPDNTTGAVEVRVNGVTDFSESGIDTLVGSDTQTSIHFGATVFTNTCTVQFDDVYICDDTGGVNDDFLGDVQVKMLVPDGNGSVSDFVGIDADSTDNYLHVDEAPAIDDDTSYTESSTSTEQDLYTYDDLPTAAVTVLGVETKTIGKKVDAGAANLKSICLSNAVEDAVELGLSTDYVCVRAIHEQNPDGPAAWTPTTLNAAEFGVEVV